MTRDESDMYNPNGRREWIRRLRSFVDDMPTEDVIELVQYAKTLEVFRKKGKREK